MDEKFGDPRLGRLFEYWRSKRGDNALTRKADIDLSEITRLLPILQMIDVERDPMRFQHRLVGTEIVDAMGRDVTGLYVDRGLYGDTAEEIASSLAEVVREGRPYRRLAHLSWHIHDWLEVEAVELPLVDDDGAVVTLLCGAIFRRREPGRGPRLVHEPLPVSNGAP